MSVEFHDFSIEVKDAMEEAVIAWLYEATGELHTATVRNTPNGTWNREIIQAWKQEVDESKLEGVVGNPLEKSLWVEFGTGEFSDSPKGGRKGYWVYVKGNDSGGNPYTYKGGKQYTLDEAKQIVAMMRADGLDAWYTKGQRPKRPMRKAYTNLRPKLIRLAEERFGKL